jgi:hypothetical protein
MLSSGSLAQRKARFFAKICGGLAITALVIRAVVSGGLNIGVMILVVYVAIIALVTGRIRKRGASRGKAAFLANGPMGVLMICAMVFGETDRRIERQLLPDWVVAGVFLFVGLLVSTIAVCAVARKSDNLA